MASYRTYKWRKLAALPALLAYFAFATVARPAGETEAFPFFRWSLFSETSAIARDNVIYITAIDGQPLVEPRNFYDLPQHFQAARSRDAIFFKSVDRLVHAVQSGDSETEIRQRALIERNYFSRFDRVDYQVSVIEYDPIERYESGTVRSRQILREFVAQS